MGALETGKFVMVKAALDAICGHFDECETLAFVDLSTQMVLVSNTTTPESQDTLNALCAEAGLALQSGDQAMVCTSQQFRLFVRSPSEPSDALCCICSLRADVSKLLPAMQACLNEITDGDSKDE